MTIAEFVPASPSSNFHEALVEIEFRANTNRHVYVVKRLHDGERFGAHADELHILIANYSPARRAA